MCGRFVITETKPFGIDNNPSYNISPSSFVPVKTILNCKLMIWSYSPYWKKDMNLINCRSESMYDKPSFKNAKRCIIYQNGWFEWKRTDTEKIPYYHYCNTNYFAGLYNQSGCLILTKSSNERIKHIHHRQPILLNEHEIDNFLNGEDLFNSLADEEIQFYRVSKDVNNTRNNKSSLIKEII